jgi:hypothetical protein
MVRSGLDVPVSAATPLADRLARGWEVITGRVRSGYEISPARRGAAFSVSLTGGSAGGSVAADVQLAWWVHDAVTAYRITSAEVIAAIRSDLDDRIRAALQQRPVPDTAHAERLLSEVLGADRMLVPEGVTYGHGRAELAISEATRNYLDEMDEIARQIRLEQARQQLADTKMAFYRKLIRGGEDELLAYWLLTRPEQAPEVAARLAEREGIDEDTDELLRRAMRQLENGENPTRLAVEAAGAADPTRSLGPVADPKSTRTDRPARTDDPARPEPPADPEPDQ